MNDFLLRVLFRQDGRNRRDSDALPLIIVPAWCRDDAEMRQLVSPSQSLIGFVKIRRGLALGPQKRNDTVVSRGSIAIGRSEARCLEQHSPVQR